MSTEPVDNSSETRRDFPTVDSDRPSLPILGANRFRTSLNNKQAKHISSAVESAGLSATTRDNLKRETIANMQLHINGILAFTDASHCRPQSSAFTERVVLKTFTV